VIKQYVNLNYHGKKHHGRTVHLRAEASDITKDDVERAEWSVVPEGRDNTAARYLSHAARARMRRKVTGNIDNRFGNTVYLPHVGGDRYTINVAKRGDDASAKELEVIQTWRKIYYTVHYMNRRCKRIFNAVKARFAAAFEEAFIELEEVALKRTRKDEPQTRSTDFLGHLYNRQSVLRNRPFHLRIVVVNDIGDIVGARYSETGLSTKRKTIETDDGLSTVRGYPWLKKAQGRVEPRGRWHNIDSCARKAGDRRVTIDLRRHRHFSRAIDAGRTVEIRLRTREFDAYCGHSIGNFCCVRINEDGSDAQVQTTILQTFTHELGHGLQQVVRRERTFDDRGVPSGWKKNTLWHTDDKGGQGPHCAKNAKTVASDRTASGRIYTHGRGTLCTMFFRDDDEVDASGKFCDSCLPRLKRVNIGATAMRRQGWNRC
jgi:hypothetical protein